ncbi:hypothetical protein EDD18DRAFT_1221650 [Armillaria luteobubalina]|uniref:Uncharacterized protein n=1 Tax=Armillaria luteobubalina TaxID=153913 RepID=A0AA39NYN4_9AGAR|nr:hypothetical protein EDD18DRAFT_1221650 [Armillaria luteobubalina]
MLVRIKLAPLLLSCPDSHSATTRAASLMISACFLGTNVVYSANLDVDRIYNRECPIYQHAFGATGERCRWYMLRQSVGHRIPGEGEMRLVSLPVVVRDSVRVLVQKMTVPATCIFPFEFGEQSSEKSSDSCRSRFALSMI